MTEHEPAAARAHARGLLLFWEAAKLLDLRPIDVILEMRDGKIEHEKIDGLPCVTPAALDAYRRLVA